MSDNLVLELLRAIRTDIAEIRIDVRDIKHRLTAVEIGLSNLSATQMSNYAHVALRLDRNEERIERIERRLDLRDA